MIVVDAGVIQQLVRRATEGNPLGRPARPDHPGFGACQLRGTGCCMLTRLPSVSVNDTYRPTPGISVGSPSTFTPAAVT